MLADAGFDFPLFDTQHLPVDVKQLIPAIACCAASGQRRSSA
ncbi:MAG: hypothetical protein U0841_00195 [Chloroflexia bacterium]